MCCFDDADNDDDDNDGYREAYNDTHLETESALLSCVTTQAHLHILPPGATASEKGDLNHETKGLPHILDGTGQRCTMRESNKTHLAHSVCSPTEALGGDGQVVYRKVDGILDASR